MSAASAAFRAAQARASHYATRSPSFTRPTARHLESLRSIVEVPCPRSGRKGQIRLQETTESLASFAMDWTKHVAAQACPAVLFPTCTEHVEEIMKFCAAQRLAVVPQGGNTGLVYGGQPLFDELILSLQHMNTPPQVNVGSMSIEAEAGVILQTCQEASEQKELLFPLSMGSKGSALVGGCISTNAGGIYYARYGSMHANTLGLEVVTAKGERVNFMSTLRKDNAGYDMKQLFIGGEGTLGVITKAAIRLYPKPREKQLLMVRVAEMDSVQTLYHLSQQYLPDSLAAFEVMDGESLRTFDDDDLPFPRITPKDGERGGGGPIYASPPYKSDFFAVLLETHGSQAEHEMEKLGKLMEAVEENLQKDPSGGRECKRIEEPVLSLSEAQSEKLWKLREDVPVRLASSGDILKFDVSFPLDQFYSIVPYTRELVYGVAKLPPEEVWVVGYGHFGDGNIHLNVIDISHKHEAVLEKLLYPAVYAFCAKHGGSISAEHGVGLQKRDYLSLSRSPPCLAQMRELKKVMDPHGILNPYKVLPLA